MVQREGEDEGQCRCLMWPHVTLESVRALFHKRMCVTQLSPLSVVALSLINWVADRCRAWPNVILMSKSKVDCLFQVALASFTAKTDLIAGSFCVYICSQSEVFKEPSQELFKCMLLLWCLNQAHMCKLSRGEVSTWPVTASSMHVLWATYEVRDRDGQSWITRKTQRRWTERVAQWAKELQEDIWTFYSGTPSPGRVTSISITFNKTSPPLPPPQTISSAWLISRPVSLPWERRPIRPLRGTQEEREPKNERNVNPKWKAGENTSRMLNNNGQLESVRGLSTALRQARDADVWNLHSGAILEGMAREWETAGEYALGESFPYLMCVAWFAV